MLRMLLPCFRRPRPKIPFFRPGPAIAPVLIPPLGLATWKTRMSVKLGVRGLVFAAGLFVCFTQTVTAETSNVRPLAANTQFAAADGQANTKAMSDRANEIIKNMPRTAAGLVAASDVQVVSSDQLNDVDRALHEGTPPAPVAAPTAEPHGVHLAAVMPGSTEASSWDGTSLIGKIFIGFGVLLTVASAARMFMA